MRIYIDVSMLLKQNFISGIQRTVIEYTLRLLKKREYDVWLFSTSLDGKQLYLVSNEAFTAFYTYRSDNKQRCITGKSFQVSDMKRGEVYLELDATWGSPLKRGIFFDQLKKQGVVIVSYIYDIIAITAPQFMFQGLINDFIPYAVAHLTYSDMIVCSTEFTVGQIRELCRRYGIPETRYGIAPLGSDFQVDPKRARIKTQDEAKALTALGEKYILTVGTLEPRKNHKLLLDAYDRGLKEMGVQLVFVGRTGWKIDDLLRRMHGHPDYGKNLFHLEGMNDASVAWLYDHAWLVAFPTFIEGFGIPAVEALQHHVPTILSDIPVMHEVGKHYCDYCDPHDPDSFVKAVRRFFEDADYYNRRKKETHSYRPATWDDAVDMLCGCVDAAEKRGSQPAAARTVDLSGFLEQARAEQLPEALLNDIMPMRDIMMDVKMEALRTMEVHYYRELTSYYKPIGGIVIFLKRVIRKLARFIGEPMADELNEYHRRIVAAFEEQLEVNQLVYELRDRVDRLTEENRLLRSELQTERHTEHKEGSE